MKNWLNKNYKILIILAFLIPIVIVAVVSISHVTIWYGISNPLSWAMYLSLGVEIAALSALAAISASMGRNVYFPFIIVTIIQFIGNIFFSYQYIDINSKIFKDWVDLVSPLISSLGVEQGDLVGHRRFLALFSGGLLPLISLSFLHMLVKFSEDARLHKHNVINDDETPIITNNTSLEEKILKNDVTNIITDSDIISEATKIRLTDEDLKRLENILLKQRNVVKDDIIFTKENDVVKAEESYDSSVEEGYYEDIHSKPEETYQNNIILENITEEEYNNVVVEEEIEAVNIPDERQEDIIEPIIDETITDNTEIDDKIIFKDDVVEEQEEINDEEKTFIENKESETIIVDSKVDDEIIKETEEQAPIENSAINIGYQIVENTPIEVEKKN